VERFKVRADHLAKIRQMRVTVLPPKEIAAEFELEHFYGAGQ
jgi:hypothetical protein